MLKSDIEVSTFSNGLRVVSENMPDYQDRVAFAVQIDSGSNYEQADQKGLAHFVEHLICEGGKPLIDSGLNLVTYFDSKEYFFNAVTSIDKVNYGFDPSKGLALVYLKEDFGRSFNTINEALVAPGFGQIQVTKHQGVIHKEINETSLPKFDKAFNAAINPMLGFPKYFGFPFQLGEHSDIDAITYSRARDFHDTYYVPNRVIISIAGGLDHQTACSMANNWWGQKPQGTSVTLPPYRFTPMTIKMENTYIPSSKVSLYFGSATRNKPDGEARNLFTIMLRKHFFNVIREEMQLGYAPSVAWGFDKVSGVHIIGFAGDNSNVTQTLDAVIFSISNFIDRFNASRLGTFIRACEKSVKLAVRDPAKMAADNLSQVSGRGDTYSDEAWLDNMKSVTADQMFAIAREIFTSPVGLSMAGPKDALPLLPDAIEISQRINAGFSGPR